MLNSSEIDFVKAGLRQNKTWLIVGLIRFVLNINMRVAQLAVIKVAIAFFLINRIHLNMLC